MKAGCTPHPLAHLLDHARTPELMRAIVIAIVRAEWAQKDVKP